MSELVLNAANRSLLVVEIIGQDLQVRRLALKGRETRLEVEPGEYLIRTIRPSGRTHEEYVTVVADTPSPVDLEASDSAASPHEWLFDLSDTMKLESRPHPELAVPAQYLSLGNTKLVSTQTTVGRVWLRLFEKEGTSGWIPDNSAIDKSNFIADRDYGRIDIDVEPDVLKVLQVGAPGLPWRLSAVPTGSIAVVIDWEFEAPVVTPQTPIDRLTLKIGLRDASLQLGGADSGGSRVKRGDAVMRFFATSDPSSARTSGDELVVEAEQMLRGKLKDPILASIGGYYLLRVNAFERLHSWPRNLANWIRELPDGAVIHGTQLLSDPDLRDPARSCKMFIEAMERGIPVFSEGVRLLRDGLSYFAFVHAWGSDEDSQSLKQRAADAYKKLHPYLGSIDWQESITQFSGLQPDKPSLDARFGVDLETPSDAIELRELG